MGFTTLKTKAGGRHDRRPGDGPRHPRRASATGSSCGSTRTGPTRRQQAARAGRRPGAVPPRILRAADPRRAAVRRRLAATADPHADRAERERDRPGQRAGRSCAPRPPTFILPDTHIAGGILPCVKIGHVCEAAGLPCIMHCGHDLGPKTAAMLHVAAACPAYSLANDSTYYGLEDDIITEPFLIDRAGSPCRAGRDWASRSIPRSCGGTGWIAERRVCSRWRPTNSDLLRSPPTSAIACSRWPS